MAFTLLGTIHLAIPALALTDRRTITALALTYFMIIIGWPWNFKVE